MAYGWAVQDADGEINMRTVSPTRRAAIVNWLVVAADIFIHAATTDEEIEQMWRNEAGDAKAIQVYVERHH